MGSEYKSLFENKDSKGFSITVEDLAITTVQQEVKDMLDLIEPVVAKISDKIELIPMPGYSLRELVLRCIVRKAYESMLAILELSRIRHSLPVMSLLRSMCEELIFAKFIKSLSSENAEAYLHLTTQLELHKGLEAQAEFFSARRSVTSSKKSTDNIRSEEQKELLKKLISSLSQTLKELGKKLG